MPHHTKWHPIRYHQLYCSLVVYAPIKTIPSLSHLMVESLFWWLYHFLIIKLVESRFLLIQSFLIAKMKFHHYRIHTYTMLKSSFITRTDTCIHPYLFKSEISVVHKLTVVHPCSIHVPPRFRWTGDANLLRTAPWQQGGWFNQAGKRRPSSEMIFFLEVPSSKLT